MIRIKCPKCGNALGVPESAAGSAASCPQCGQKFRVPGIAAKLSGPSRPEAARQQKDSSPDDEHVAAGKRRPVNDTPARRPPARTSPARRRPEADDQEDEDFEVIPDSERSELSRPAGKRRVVDDIDEPDEEKPDRQDEAPRPPTRKKKKKKKEPTGISGAHIAWIVIALLVVVGLTTGAFFLFNRGPKPPPDPAPVLAELQQLHATIERDEKSPDKPVIGITLSGLEFKPSLLGRLVVFPKLRKLNLSSTKTSDIALEHLEDVTSLQVLSLSHTNVTGGGMQFLKKLVNLEELNLNQTLVHDMGLRELKGCTKLKKIYLDGTLASGLELADAIPGLQIIK